MKIYHGFEEARGLVPSNVYAIGNFDGIHLGHAALLKQAKDLAQKMKVGFGVYTFWPHPSVVLRTDSNPKLICTREQKLQQLKSHGVEYLIEEPFTTAFSEISAQEFAQNIVHECIQAVAVVTGQNFHFGHRAKGTAADMSEWLGSLGISCIVADTVFVEGEICSSTRIRELILSGDVSRAATVLGRNFSIVGHVVKGSGRGKDIGIPTANIKTESTLIPQAGVYRTKVRINNSSVLLDGATNIGVRPTFNGDNETHIETHILDFSQRIYGDKIEVYFIDKIRNEEKFESVHELVAQVRRDIETVRNS